MTQFVTLLVDEQLALDALEALATQAPDPVRAISAESSPVKPLRLNKIIHN